MTVTLKLTPEKEKLLKDKAANAGLSLENYLLALVERDVNLSNGQEILAPLTPAQWSVEWRAWANKERHLPAGLAIDDSRESIYAGRGE
ncbi:MAG TPA: hypothetical protein VGX70_11715 [Gemmataceae bacterium]|jgi:hypothetical protein|nr:hypothetical protein [Gemmataceae bacterium]